MCIFGYVCVCVPFMCNVSVVESICAYVCVCVIACVWMDMDMCLCMCMYVHAYVQGDSTFETEGKGDGEGEKMRGVNYNPRQHTITHHGQYNMPIEKITKARNRNK